MKKEESRDSLIDIPLEDERDESQLTGGKRQNTISSMSSGTKSVSGRRYYAHWEYCWHCLQSLQ